jgi:hypothetical protein
MPHAAPLSPLCSFGHIASYAELLDAFNGQESAVLSFRMGRLTAHLRSDVYICAHLSDVERSAAWCGGWLDCVTVLAEAGLPVGDAGTETHLRLARGDSRAAGRRLAHAPTAHMHWSRLRTPLPTLERHRRAARPDEPFDRLRVPFREALRQAMTTCLEYAQSARMIAAIDASGLGSDEDVAHAIAAAPRRVERALRELDAITPELEVALATLRSGHHF